MGTSSAAKTAFLLVLCSLFALPVILPAPANVPSAFALTAEEKKKKEEEDKKKKAEEEAKRKIKAFEDAVRSGDQARINAAARKLESDPVAVRQMKSRGGSTHTRYTAAMKQAQSERISKETQARMQYETEAAARMKSGESVQGVRSGMSTAARNESMTRDSAGAAMTGSSNRGMTGASSREMTGTDRSAMTGSSSSAQVTSPGKLEEVRRAAAEKEAEQHRQTVARANAAAAAAQAAAAEQKPPPPPPRVQPARAPTAQSRPPTSTAATPAARPDTAVQTRIAEPTGSAVSSSSASASMNTSAGGGTDVIDARAPRSGTKTGVLKSGEVAPSRPVTGQVNPRPSAGGGAAAHTGPSIDEIMREARMSQPVVTPENSGIRMKGRQPLPDTPPVQKFKGEPATWSEINKRVTASSATQTDGPTTWVDDDATAALAKKANPQANVKVKPQPKAGPPRDIEVLRKSQADELSRIKTSFDAEARRAVPKNPDGTINTNSPEYRKLEGQYDQTVRHTRSRHLAQDTRGSEVSRMEGRGRATSTGSMPKDVRADADVTFKGDKAMQQQMDDWVAHGDKVKVVRDSRGKIRKVINETRDITGWSPEEATAAGRKAQLDADMVDDDAFRTPGGQRGTGGSKELPRDAEGYILDNKAKLQHADEIDDLKTVAKSADKAAKHVGIDGKNPELRRQMEQLRNYDDAAQAKITHLGQDDDAARAAIDKAKGDMRGIADEADEVARARSALTQKSRSALAEDLAKQGHTDTAGRIKGRADAVDDANAQVRSMLEGGGRTPTGQSPLTKGKSSVAPGPKDLSKQINTMADDLTKLPPAYQQQALDDIRATQGDDFANRLTQQMKVKNKTGRTPKEFAGKAAQAAMTGVAATAMTAEEFAKTGSRKLKSGEELDGWDAARGVEAGMQALPEYGLGKAVAQGSYNTTHDKTREVLIRRDIRKEIAKTDDPKRIAALEKQLQAHGGPLTADEAALDPEAAAAQELSGYMSGDVATVVARTVQGKDTFVVDAAGKVAGVVKGVVVDLPAEHYDRNVEEARARAKAEGREDITWGEQAGVVGDTAFDTVSDIGPKQAAEGIDTILSGWEADRAEQGNRDELRGRLDNKFSRHSASLGRIQREIEALDPNDPQAAQRKQELLGEYNDHYGKMQGMGEIAGRRLGDPSHRLQTLDGQMADLSKDRAKFDEYMKDPDFRKQWFDAVEARGNLEDEVESGGNLTDAEKKFLDNLRNRRKTALDPENMSGYADMFVPKAPGGEGDPGPEAREDSATGDGEPAGEEPSQPPLEGYIPGQPSGGTQVAEDDGPTEFDPEMMVDPEWLFDGSEPPGGDGGKSNVNINDLRNAENGGGYQPGDDVDLTMASNMNVSGDQVDRQGQNFDEWSKDAQATAGISAQERGNAANAEHAEQMDNILDQGAEAAWNVAKQATQHDSASASQATLNKQKAETGQRIENVAKASFGSFVSELGNQLGRAGADQVTGKDIARVDPTVGDGSGGGSGDPANIGDPPLTGETVSKPPAKNTKKNTNKNKNNNNKKKKNNNKNRNAGKGNSRSSGGSSISVSSGGRNRSNVKFFHGNKNNNKPGKPPKKPRCNHKPGGCPGKSPGDICYCGC